MSEPETGSFCLQQLRQRDAETFRRLVEANQRLVMSLAQSMGLEGADADDAAAEAFAAVYQALPGFGGKSQVSTWVYRIAVRTLARLRKRRSQAAPLPDEAPDRRQAAPDAHAEETERHRRLWDAVAQLEPRQAAAVEMYYRQGWAVDKISQALGCPGGTVKTLLFRAREQLRQALGEEDGR